MSKDMSWSNLAVAVVLVDGVYKSDDVSGRVRHVGDGRVGVKTYSVHLVTVLES